MIETMVTGSEPMKFSDEHYIAFGKLVVSFQYLEEVITYAIALIAEPDITKNRILDLVVNELSFSNRLKLLSNLVETTPVDYFVPLGCEHERGKREEYSEFVENLRTGIRLAREAEERRNQLIHSYWFTEPMCGPPGVVLRSKTRARPDKTIRQLEHITAEVILSVVSTLEQARDLIYRAAWHLNLYLGMHATSNSAVERDAPQTTHPVP